MTYLVETTFLGEEHSADPSFKPQRQVRDEPEDAVQIFMESAEFPEGFDRGELVERLTNGGWGEHRDDDRLVSVRPIPKTCSCCERPCPSWTGWSLVKQGLLCPDCAYRLCPDHRISAVGALS